MTPEAPAETMILPRIDGETLAGLLSCGWRHFGPFFFREHRAWNDRTGRFSQILPLRIEVAGFNPGRTWQKLLRRTRDLLISISPAQITQDHRDLFQKHIKRFLKNIPNSLEDFLGPNPALLPHPMHTLSICREGREIAVGFLDKADHATSAIYTMWDPAEGHLSPGVLVLLHAIAWTRSLGYPYLYTGYDFSEDSIYAYKHRFAATQYLDRNGLWKPWPPTTGDL